MRTIMCTGDYQHTAIAVARGVSMIPQDSQVVIVQSAAEMSPAPAAPKPIVSALKQQGNTLRNVGRSVSFRIQEPALAEPPRQSIDGLTFAYSTGDPYQGAAGQSPLVSIAQVSPCWILAADCIAMHLATAVCPTMICARMFCCVSHC